MRWEGKKKERKGGEGQGGKRGPLESSEQENIPSRCDASRETSEGVGGRAKEEITKENGNG